MSGKKGKLPRGNRERGRGEKRKVPGKLQPELKGGGGFRIPSVFMVPVGLAVGWFVASWAGAIFGGIIGVFLWRSRA